MTGRRLALVAVAAAAVALVGSALASHSWGSYHWARTSNPFTLKVGDNVDSRWDAYLDQAISDWSTSSVLDLTKVAGGTNPRNCRPTQGRIEVCNALYGNTGWLGLAQIWASGSHITQAIAKLNDTYHNTSTYNTVGWRSLVMCQEVGHDFGLGHQDENFNNAPITPHTCMDYHVPDHFEHPNQHDYDQLATIYSHLDSSTTVASAPASLPGNAPPFSQASRANGSLYVDELGGGRRLITYVFWTPFGE
jgi:hypothetical protein